MEEDIDKLLEEVENKFINENGDDKPRKYLKANIFSPQSSFRCDSSDYEDILRDVDDNTDPKSVSLRNLRRDQTSAGSVTSKCFPVYLGGSECSSGLSSIGTPRTCNNLHCISCDFAVYTFDGFQWLPSTDYLFLRTNMPEFEGVKSNLVTTDGCRAYACQCRHYSTSILQQVNNIPLLTWICRSHILKSPET
ncbi:hypothetical protein C0J52_22037 [Blattella germanica]|nr:hypothetical protein C0J52_22037 [Blattella germanica]